jgi:putative sigma-54 modulation protein
MCYFLLSLHRSRELESEGKTMQIIIKGKQMQVTPQMRQRIEHKVQRLSRLVHDDSRVEVTVIEEQTRSSNDRFCVQMALSTTPHPVHSEVSAVNVHTALDLVLDKVMTQLGRQKDRQTKARRHHSLPAKTLSLSRAGELATVERSNTLHDKEELDELEELNEMYPALEEEQNEAIWSRIVEIRRLPTKPMTDQEVIAQMENDKLAFCPFFNQETKSVNVMYRLDNGGYGLLVPALAEE